MKASEILEVARKQEITSAGVQASVGIAEHTGDFELANKLRALLIILNRAEAESGDI